MLREQRQFRLNRGDDQTDAMLRADRQERADVAGIVHGGHDEGLVGFLQSRSLRARIARQHAARAAHCGFESGDEVGAAARAGEEDVHAQCVSKVRE